ncbi:MAG: hypothetical protein AAGJ51_04820 [Pseudomonadota bacterium]
MTMAAFCRVLRAKGKPSLVDVSDVGSVDTQADRPRVVDLHI